MGGTSETDPLARSQVLQWMFDLRPAECAFERVGRLSRALDGHLTAERFRLVDIRLTHILRMVRRAGLLSGWQGIRPT